MKVLVIDDSELARSQIRALLTRAGMEVFEQPSAIGATRPIMQNAIDVAVVDVNMPGLSGPKRLGVLRQNSRLKHLVLIVISGRSWSEPENVARDSGADALLPKDRVEDELADVIKRVAPMASARRVASA